MRCLNELYRVRDDVDWGLFNKPLKRKFYNRKDFEALVGYYGEHIFQTIPCGQCIACRINYSQQWAERCYVESLNHEKNCFLTLTYDDEHLPFSEFGYPTLVKRDIQLFMKRLRKAIDCKISFYCSGEYGDTTFRPHYHLLLFGYEPDDLVLFKWNRTNKEVYPLFNSKKIDELWGKGFVTISKLCGQTCLYTASYSVKKFKISVKFFEHFKDKSFLSDVEKLNLLQAEGKIQPIFSLMSRRPSIARWKYDDSHYSIMLGDDIPESRLRRLRYYDKLFEVDHPDLWNQVQLFRQEQAKGKLDLRPQDRLTDYNQKVVDKLIASLSKRIKL